MNDFIQNVRITLCKTVTKDEQSIIRLIHLFRETLEGVIADMNCA